MLDNRELASLILVTVGLCGAAFYPKVRAAIASLARILAAPAIVTVFATTFAYIAFEAWAGSQFGLWNFDLLKATVIWSFATGIVLVFNVLDPQRRRELFWRTAKGTLGVAVLLEFYLNIRVFSLAGELVLQLVVTPLTILATVAALRAEHSDVKKLLNWVLALIGFGVLGLATMALWNSRDQLQAWDLALEFALPVWLTIGFLPFLYLLAIFAGYDSIFRRINHATADPAARRRARRAVLAGLGLGIRGLGAFHGGWVHQLAASSSSGEARRIVSEFRQRLQAEDLAAVDNEWTLRYYAGSDETDPEGRRLDRREFEETMDALRWISTCQMGRYPHRGEYQSELLEIVAVTLVGRGLPEEHGIQLHVSHDGQAWYAWRRTVTGWCFAIGAAAKPPDEWLYDGPEPPTGFPGQDTSWGDGPFGGDASRNWQ